MYTHTEIAAIIEHATKEVAAQMLRAELVCGPFHLEPHGTAVFRGVLAWLGLTGRWKGVGEFCCSPEAASDMASMMLQEEFSPDSATTDPVLDVVAEIANIVVGNIKNSLEERLGALDITIPTVVCGPSFHYRHRFAGPYIVAPFRLGQDCFEVRLCVEPNHE